MAKAKSKLRMPQRSETVAGDEAEGMKPIAAAQKKSPALRTARNARPSINPKTGRPPKAGR